MALRSPTVDLLVASLTALAGCVWTEGGEGPEGHSPVVSDMSPTSGPWGTEVVIEGSGFGAGDPGGGLSLEAPESPFGAIAPEVVDWTDTRITTGYPFPASGAVTLTIEGGAVVAGAFAPDAGGWKPGAGLAAGGMVLAAVGLSSGAVAAIHAPVDPEAPAPAQLELYDGDVATIHDLAVADLVATRVALFEAEAGGPEVLATSAGGELVDAVWAGDAVAAETTGVTGRLVAGGRDAGGVFAWIDRGDGALELYRAGQAWSSVRTVNANWMSGRDLDAAVAADGTLVVAYTEGPPDGTQGGSVPAVAWLPPGADGFDAFEIADETYRGSIARMRLSLSGDGKIVLLEWYGTSDEASPGANRRVRGPDPTWTEPMLAADPASDASWLVTDAGLAVAWSHPDGITLRTDASVGEDLLAPLWPARVAALVAGPDGPRLLVETASGGPATFAPVGPPR